MSEAPRPDAADGGTPSEGSPPAGGVPTDSLTAEVGRACARIALDRMGREVKLLYVGDKLGIAEWFVLATVNNRRQARAVKDAVRVGLKGLGFGVPVSASEDPEGRWSLYDYGGVVLHLFDDEGREYFDLDSMWADVPQEKVEDLPAVPMPEPKSTDPFADDSTDDDSDPEDAGSAGSDDTPGDSP